MDNPDPAVRGQQVTYTVIGLNTGSDPANNVIVRLAESASDWKHRDVRPAIGHWCEGYITLRGSWCEPITPALMKRLNHRLAEVHRQRKAARQEAAR